MNVLVSAGLMSCIVAVVLLVFYKLIKAYIKYRSITNCAIKLLTENKNIENLPKREDRMKAVVAWKNKRDSLLFKAESLERQLNETD